MNVSPVKDTSASYMNGSVRVDAEFFGSTDSKMFGCRHSPVGSADAGVVICCSIQSETMKNYRRELLLAQSLAEKGFAAQRFHYRGTGNSDGDGASLTFESMRDDALAAARLLLEETGVTRLAFVGTRWGALIAASAATEFEGAPVVLWEPIVDSRRYFKEVFRYRLMHALKKGSQTSSDALLDEMREKGSLDILGYTVHRELYDSSIELSLAGSLGDVPRPLLMVQTNGNEQLRGEYVTLTKRWEELAFPVATRVVTNREAWWFAGERWQSEEVKDSTRVLIEETQNWLTERLRTEA